MRRSVYIGFDPREAAAYAVARATLRARLTQQIPVKGLLLNRLQEAGLYKRPTSGKLDGEGRFFLIDELSVTPGYSGRLSTWHANARFFVPMLAKEGWALFTDGDFLFRPGANICRVFDGLDPGFALYCVQHDHQPAENVKMDGQVQTSYWRKNWSSFMIFNCDHEANRRLTLEHLNTLPGRELHRFCWLQDEEIAALPRAWNHLVGHSPPWEEPLGVHFTSGTPDMLGYEKSAYADEWREALYTWAE